jgi:hypothetical protein
VDDEVSPHTLLRMGKAGKEEALEEQRGWREIEPQTYVKLTAHAKL